mgnify:CR=1 FL=1|tara:strand:- start:1662 stop:1883 length:222 start_codon:yes stop_codon:yes gene_type:complete
MTPTEIRLKELSKKVGEDSAYDFRRTVELATDDLIKNIDNSFITDETKHDYVTYVFANILDRIIDQSKLKHLN